MRCPFCHQTKTTSVVSSRQQTDGSILRRRECRSCDVRWSTREAVTANPERIARELPPVQPGSHDCRRCQQWSERHQSCGLGFPEGRMQPSFAADCLHYQPPDDEQAAAA